MLRCYALNGPNFSGNFLARSVSIFGCIGVFYTVLAVFMGVHITQAEAANSTMPDFHGSFAYVSRVPQINPYKLDIVSAPQALSGGVHKSSVTKVQPQHTDWMGYLMALVTDPNVTYLLLILGFYGVVFEIAGPGLMLPGTLGMVALILAAYGLSILSIDYFALAGMLLGVGLMIGGAAISRLKRLDGLGVLVFTIGSLWLFKWHDSQASLLMIGTTAAISSVFFTWLLRHMLGLRRRGAVSGREAIMGALGEAAEDFSGKGHVHLNGELWRALCNSNLRQGQQVRVIGIKGLELIVVPEENQSCM